MASRIGNNGPVVTPTVTSTQPTPAPTAPATTPQSTVWGAGDHTPRPNDAFNPGAIANVVSGRVAGQGNAYELVPGRAPNTVGLPQLLAGMGRTAQGEAMVNKLLGELKTRTGVSVPPPVVAAIRQNPAAATKAFEVTPGELAAGIGAMNAAYQEGKLKAPEPRKLLLPQKFDFKDFASVDAPRPGPSLKELAPGVFTGDLPSDLPDAQLKQNRVMAEVFHRLALNTSAPASEKFEVTYDGKSFTNLGDFATALKHDGYEVNVTFEQRIANFAALKTAVPGTNPPQLVDVPAPLMVKTGITDAQGHEALVPAVHSEMIVSLKSGPDTKGPKMDAQVKYYQGTTGTGFFPVGTSQTPAWLGRVSHAEVKGRDALSALKLAGAFSDVVTTVAKDKNLYADGYGVTGVCNDSVAIVQHAVTGTYDQYPLLMQDAVLLGELKTRLNDGDYKGDSLYKKLRASINELPSDAQPNATSKERALKSIPWEAGKEPFQSTVDARKILSE